MKLKNKAVAILLGGALAVVTSLSLADKGGLRSQEYANKHNAKQSEWIYEGVKTLSTDRKIKHYSWLHKVGDGPYDMIRVHRYVRQANNKDARPRLAAVNKRKVLFVINGTWGQEGPEPLKEFDSYYFPKNGYDLWTMDFRTAFIPNLAYEQFEEKGESEGLLSTAGWTYSVFREDIKQAVNFAKHTSRARKVFLAGRSRGGSQAFIYAAKYAKDLKGIIGLDGGPVYQAIENPELQQPESAYRAALQGLASGLSGLALLNQVSGYENSRLIGALPNVLSPIGAPLPSEAELPFGPPPNGLSITNLADLSAYESYWLGGAGLVTNIYTLYPGGEGETYMDQEALSLARANYSRYWPFVQNLESSFLAGYADNPYLDYDDTQDITLPVIHFVGDFGCPMGSCLDLHRPYSTSSSDFSVKYLPGFGHLDIYYGTHSESDVKKPMLEWMNERL
ncbi:MAG: hypothetical protein JKY66_08330 [Spongiibacteraceae bacterium]|nr:hypothetical protein [Spongiibacteraceae bacterium]